MIRLLFSLLIFSAASSWANDSYVVDQTGCLQQGVFPCALRAEKRMTLEIGTLKIALSEGAMLNLLAAGEVQLLSGRFMLSGKWKSTKMGAVETSGQAEFLAELSESGRVDVAMLSGDYVNVLYKQDLYERLSLGFGNWYDGVKQGGKLNAGVARPMFDPQTLQNYLSMSDGSRKEKLDRVIHYKKQSDEVRSVAAARYAKQLQGELDAGHEAELKRQKQKRRQEQQNAELRRMFRQKNYLSD